MTRRSSTKLQVSRVAAGLAALTLTACATAPEPRVVTKTVNVAIPVRCTPDPAPKKPDLPDTDAALAAVPDVFTGTKLLKAGRKLRDGYIGELEAALGGCTGQ